MLLYVCETENNTLVEQRFDKINREDTYIYINIYTCENRRAGRFHSFDFDLKLLL